MASKSNDDQVFVFSSMVSSAMKQFSCSHDDLSLKLKTFENRLVPIYSQALKGVRRGNVLNGSFVRSDLYKAARDLRKFFKGNGIVSGFSAEGQSVVAKLLHTLEPFKKQYLASALIVVAADDDVDQTDSDEDVPQIVVPQPGDDDYIYPASLSVALERIGFCFMVLLGGVVLIYFGPEGTRRHRQC